MVKNIFSILLMFLVFTTNAQVSQLNGILDQVDSDASARTSNPTSGGSDTSNVVYEVVEIQPSPPGGMAGWNKYLMENLRYPTNAQRKGIEGTVIVAFVVNTDGTTTDIEILRSVGGGCDEEVIRIVKGSPKWTPGMHAGPNTHALASSVYVRRD